MRYYHGSLLVVICCLGLSGCNAKAIQLLEDRVVQLEEENMSLKAQLAEANQALKEAGPLKKQIAEYLEIKKGYEEARLIYKAKMKEIGPLLGLSGDFASPLPPFEELKNSDWVSKMTPSGGGSGSADLLKEALKGLQNIKELKGIEAELIKEYLGDGKDKKKNPQPKKP